MANGQTFDVFLSYSRTDAEAVRQVQLRLTEAGLATFLDRDQLPAGQSWLTRLEHAIAHCGAVAVFVGPAGLGTWQQREIQLALDRQAEAERAGSTFPVIPILLPRVEDPPGGFLRLETWVDLRSDLADPAQLNSLLAGIRGQAPAGVSTLREAFCPYRGLLPFREEDAGFFFGREQEVKELVGKLRENNLISLVGRSGSGKSSVVYAGLIPALRRRVDGRTWSILSLRPGPEPLHAFVRALDPPPADLPPFEADQRVEQQVEILRTTDGALGRRIRSLLANPDERGTERLLLYVDQWEELYTQALRPSSITPEQAEADVTRFIDLLLDATRTSPCTVVLTVRADFYGELLKHGPLAAAVPSGQVNLGPMRREGLAAAIEEPAKAVSLSVDPPLLEELLDEVCNDLGKLPLLEYALKETWNGREGKRLTLNAYGQSGGIEGAIAKRANEIFAHLKPAEQDAARRLFVSLVTPGEGREDTRAVALYPEDEATRAVVQEFSDADARLLVTGAEAPTTQRLVEISHEALIREWDLLREWIGVNREALRRREHIRAWMRQWEENDRNKTLLLPPGLPLEEGRKLLTDHGDVLIGEIEPYIDASLAQEAFRRLWRGAGFAVIAVVAVTMASLAWFANSERDRAELNATLAQQQRDRAEERLLAAQIARSHLLAKLSQDRTASGDATAGILLALEALPRELTDKRLMIFEALAALTQASLNIRERAVLSHQSLVGAIAFSTDGRNLATASHDGMAQLWDTKTGQRHTLLKHDGVVETINFSPGGHILATASRDGMARLWDVVTGQERAVLRHETVYVRGAVFSPDGNTVATKSDNYGPNIYNARLWDVATGQERAVLGHQNSVGAIAFSPDGRTLATASDDNTARLWDVATGQERAVLKHQRPANAVAFSPDGRTLATASDDNTARLWDVATGQERAVLKHQRPANAVAFSPDGRTLATASDDTTARLWDVATGQERAVLGHQNSVGAIAFSPDGRTLATASDDTTARLWDVATGQERAVLKHQRPANAVAFSPDGRTLATASQDGTARLWDVAIGLEYEVSSLGSIKDIVFSPNWRTFATIPGAESARRWNMGDNTARLWDLATGQERTVLRHTDMVWAAVFAPDGRTLATASRDKTARLWDVATGQEQAVLKHTEGVYSIVFSQDGRALATGSFDRSVRLWDVATGQERAVLRGHKIVVGSLAFSPDGRTLATASADNTARLWDVATGQERAVLGHQNSVGAIAFSPDGRTLATASDDNTARLWDVATGQERAVLGHQNSVGAIAFSPDGRTLATASDDNTARLWDVATGQERAVLRGHEDRVSAVTFSPDGRTLATASKYDRSGPASDRTTRLWDVATGKERAVLKHKGWVTGIAFSPDGRTLATASDKIVQIVTSPPIEASEIIDNARRKLPVGRLELTKDEREEASLPPVQAGKQ